MKTEEKLKTLVSNIPGAVYQCDFDTNWTMHFISDMIESISGYPASGFVQNRVRAYADIIHPDDRKMVETVVQEAVGRKNPFIIEYRIIHANGSIRWVHEQGQGIFDADEQPLYLDGAIFDVTDNKLSRDALRESEERFRSLVAAANEAIISVDTHGTIVDWNTGAEKMFGYSTAEIMGKPLLTVVPKQHSQTHHHIFAQLELGQKSNITTEIIQASGVNSDGREFPINFSLAGWQAGGKNYITAIIRDISEHQKIMDALHLSEQRFRAIADFSNNWEYWINPKGELSYISPACQKISGYRPKAFEQDATLLQSIIHPEDEANVAAQIQNWRCDSNIIDTGVDYRIINKKGETLWINQICKPVYDTNQEYLGYHVTIQDITERKQMADELRQYNRHLQALSRRLVETQEAERRHLARELHDGAGQALTSLMLRLKAVAHETELDAVLDRVAGLRALTIQTLEDIRRLSRNLRPAALDDLGLMAALQDHVDMFRRDTAIAITFEADTHFERLSPDAEISLYRGVQEALTNVARHAGAKNVLLSLHQAIGWVCIEIIDDGQGFDISAIYPATTETGVGLLGMNERVELLGGYMQVKSTPGQGTQISLRIPLEGNIENDGTD